MSEITIEQVRKLVRLVDAGLTQGLGHPRQGQMCVEAAVCRALGLEHSDHPPCVEDTLRVDKIELNDQDWSSKQARGRGMKKLALAQLGTAGVLDGEKFHKRVCQLMTQKMLPAVIRNVAKQLAKEEDGKHHTGKLMTAAKCCEKSGTRAVVTRAKEWLRLAKQDAEAAYNDADEAYDTAVDLADAEIIDALSHIVYGKDAATRDKLLGQCADLMLKALREQKVPGLKWLKYA